MRTASAITTLFIFVKSRFLAISGGWELHKNEDSLSYNNGLRILLIICFRYVWGWEVHKNEDGLSYNNVLHIFLIALVVYFWGWEVHKMRTASCIITFLYIQVVRLRW